MKPRYCYWTVADGEHVSMAEAMIRSARSVGVFNDFHVWADRPVEGAVNHALGRLEKWGCLFKLTYLRDGASKLPFDYLIFLDADTWFVRNPGDPLQLMEGSPVHVTLENDLCEERFASSNWWGCPALEFARLLHSAGVSGRSAYTTNAGLFIVHRDAVSTFFDLCFEFWHYCESAGYRFGDEPLLVYAMHMLCGDPTLHALGRTHHMWATDWRGAWADRLPNGDPWPFTDHLTGEQTLLNPAIVHAKSSKSALLRCVWQEAPPAPP